MVAMRVEKSEEVVVVVVVVVVVERSLEKVEGAMWVVRPKRRPSTSLGEKEKHWRREPKDYTKVFTGGPWIAMDHYATVRKWQQDFKSDDAEEDTTALWVRFPNLPIEYYNEKALYHIAEALGVPLKIDINTIMASRGKYTLDRAMCNTEWRTNFPKGLVQNFPRTYSDHSSMKIFTQGKSPPNLSSKSFKFVTAWISHEEFQSVNLAFKASVWNKETFGNIFRNKRWLLGRESWKGLTLLRKKRDFALPRKNRTRIALLIRENRASNAKESRLGLRPLTVDLDCLCRSLFSQSRYPLRLSSPLFASSLSSSPSLVSVCFVSLFVSLSRLWRTTLIQSVSSALPTYAMQTMELPIKLCKDIDRINRNFLWGDTLEKKRMHLVKWDEEGLWKDVLKNKYLKTTSLHDWPKGRPASHVWRGILKSRETLRKGVKCEIGNGKNVDVWKDWWCGNKPLVDLVSDTQQSNHNKSDGLTVNNIINEQGNWDVVKMNEIFSPNISTLIHKLPRPPTADMDTRTGRGSSDGVFTTSSAYNIISGNLSIEEDWNWLWKLRLPQKLKSFLWTALHGKLLTNQSREKKGLTSDPLCLSCNEVEDMNHLLEPATKPKLFGRIKLNTDGCRKLGGGGFGGLFGDVAGAWVFGYYGRLQDGTSLENELWAIYKGLIVLLQRGMNKVIIETDALLEEETETNLPYKGLIEDAKIIMPGCEYTVQLVLKEGNLCAGALAKLGAEQPEDILVVNEH
ncbi:hypothetical protein CsSME_00040977 [Camellia sinensis var. sinensis]